MIRKNKDNTVTFPCIRCDTEIISSFPLDGNTNDTNDVLDKLMWNDGGVDTFSLNYGSIYDSNVYAIGLCDKCLKKLIKDKKILFLYNYMGYYNEDEKNILDEEFRGLDVDTER